MERRREKARERKHAADGTAGGSDVGLRRHDAKKVKVKMEDDDEAVGSGRPYFGRSQTQTQAQALWDEGLRHEQDGRAEAALAALTKVSGQLGLSAMFFFFFLFSMAAHHLSGIRSSSSVSVRTRRGVSSRQRVCRWTRSTR